MADPCVIEKYPIFGLGYRSPWVIGNIAQAKAAKKLKLNVILVQQSVREIERTGRSFAEVMESARVAAKAAGLENWGADADHLKEAAHVREAVKAGYTHFTYDVSGDLGPRTSGLVERVEELLQLTREGKGGEEFTAELSLDETAETTKLEDIKQIVEELGKKGVKLDEIAPRFPGHFEKGIDYYATRDARHATRDTAELEEYLGKLSELTRELGVRTSIHSGSDKFSIYPLLKKHLGDNIHLKTAGTFYLEEMQIVARHEPDLLREVYAHSLKGFETERASYELSTDSTRIPSLDGLNGEELAGLLRSGDGNDDLRQVMHVTYGSAIKSFGARIEGVLREHVGELEKEFEEHIRRHVSEWI